MAQYLGNCRVKVNGDLCKTVPGSVVLNFGGKTRTSTMADGTYNFAEKDAPATLEAKFLHTDKTQIKKLNALAGGTVEIETDFGTVYAITSATRSGEPLSSNDSDGQITFRCEGDPIKVK